MARKKLTIGLFGFGTVGQGFVAALGQSKGISATIKKIVVQDIQKPRTLPARLFTTDASAVLNDSEIDVIIELIDDADTALKIVEAALENGKAVITANKRLIAENLLHLVALQRKHQLPVLYEAAACGSIPIIRNLEEYYDNDLLKGLEGIFNGSSNYVLTRAFRDGLPAPKALEEAFVQGFLEADPRLDLEGGDAAYKLSILTAHAFGVYIDPVEVPCFGIADFGHAEIRFARENAYQLKLVARAFELDNDVVTLVAPQFITSKDRLFAVNDEYNAVVLEGRFLEGQMLLGKGAGGYPTGSAVLSDLSALTYGYRYEYRKLKAAPQQAPQVDIALRVYLRFQGDSLIEDIEFTEIEERFEGKAYGYLTGRIQLRELLRLQKSGGAKGLFIAVLPDQLAQNQIIEIDPKQNLVAI